MNVVKVFALAIICFSISSINAMGCRTVQAIDVSNLNLSPAEEPYFGFLKNMAQQDIPTLCFVPEIPFNDYIPANIEFNNKEMADYFNIMATVALFQYAIMHPDQKNIIKKMAILPIDFYNAIQNNLSDFYHKILLILAHSEIYNLKLNHRQRDSICEKVHSNIDKIIEKVLNNSL